MPAFGNKGRWKGFVQYGIGQEQLSGMADMTGYLDENGPMKSGINHGDPITGSHATGALLASLLYRRRTGRGVYVDLSQLDSSVSLIGDAILGYQMNKRNPERRGNRHPYMAPHGIYRCRGEEEAVGSHRRRVRRRVATAVRRYRQALPRGRRALRGRAVPLAPAGRTRRRAVGVDAG